MRKLIILIVSVWTVNTINAQSTDLALANLNIEIPAKKASGEFNLTKRKSILYNVDVIENNEALIITNMRTIIASYNLRLSNVYDDSERAFYDVSFRVKNSKAHVVYNNEGSIIKSTEVYKNVQLPLTLKIKIIGENPMFEIASNKVKITYHNFLGVLISYKVVLKNGKKRKILRYDKNYNEI